MALLGIRVILWGDLRWLGEERKGKAIGSKELKEREISKDKEESREDQIPVDGKISEVMKVTAGKCPPNPLDLQAAKMPTFEATCGSERLQ